MKKNSVLCSDTIIGALMRDQDLFDRYCQVKESLSELIQDLRKHGWDHKCLETLYPNQGARIEIRDTADIEIVFPSLDDLRDQAKQMGIDISDLGRKKTAILARIRNQKAGVDSLETASITLPKLGKSND